MPQTPAEAALSGRGLRKQNLLHEDSMKYLATLVLITSIAVADTLPDQLCGVGTVATCQNLTYQSQYGRVLVEVNGKQYASNYGAIPQWAYSFENVPAYATDGSSVNVSASFRTWTTRSGRTVLEHWELLSGSVQ